MAKEESVYGKRNVLFVTAAGLVLALAGCGGQDQAQTREQTGNRDQTRIEATVNEDGGPQEFTPIIGRVLDAPIPFAGSDGRTHLVYELEATNFSSGEAVAALGPEEVAGRLQPAGLRDTADGLAPSTTALVFLHVTFDGAGDVPDRLVHRLSLRAEAAPPDQQEITEEVGPTEVDRRRDVVVVGPPLRGTDYLAADSCCDATRHTRAALPIDGRIWLAQRYAVDYEQLDADNRIYSGEKEDLDSYTI